jgi:hypothetical protein
MPRINNVCTFAVHNQRSGGGGGFESHTDKIFFYLFKFQPFMSLYQSKFNAQQAKYILWYLNSYFFFKDSKKMMDPITETPIPP